VQKATISVTFASPGSLQLVFARVRQRPAGSHVPVGDLRISRTVDAPETSSSPIGSYIKRVIGSQAGEVLSGDGTDILVLRPRRKPARIRAVATIAVDDDLLAVLPGAHPGPAEQIRELAVLELYRRRVISSGKAAELLRRDRGEFIRYASRLGIPYVDLDDVELAREVEGAHNLRDP
jgi:hypothetical protein